MVRVALIILFVTCFCAACTQNSEVIPRKYEAEVFNAKWMAGEFDSDSGVFFLVGEQGSITWSTDGKSWHYSQTPVINTLLDIAINHSNNVMVAVGEGGTIIRSIDTGKNWENTQLTLPAPVELSHTRLNAVIYLSEADVWLAAGTQNTILHSADDGLTWKLVSYNTKESQLEILELFAEEQSGDVLFAAQYGTIGRSYDNGLTWKIHQYDMDVVGEYIPHVVGFHQFNKKLIATADRGRLLISNDAGLTWQLTKVHTAGYFTDSAYDPIENVIAMTTQMGEIAISRDEGDTWDLISFKVDDWPTEDVPLLSNIVYDKISQSFIVIGNSGVIARSVDGGQTWYSGIYKPLFNMSMAILLHDPNKNIYVAAGSGGVIAASSKLGVETRPLDNWTLVRPGVDQYIRKVIHLPRSDSFVAVGQLGGIWRSEDDGDTWNVVEVTYPYQNQPPHLRDILQDRESGALIAAGPAGSIIRSTDTGLSWTPVFQGEIRKGEAFTQLLYDRKRDVYLACEVLYRSVYQSVDRGLSWNKIATIDSGERNLWHGVISESMDVIVLLGEKGGIAISHDGGAKWEMALTNTFNDLYGAYMDYEGKFLLGVGEQGMILRSENGTDWQSINSGTTSTLRRIFKDPKTGALIAFGQDGTIIRSTDAGQHWVKTKTPAYSGELRSAFTEGHTKNLIIVGRDGAILRSVDSGITWKYLKSHTKQHFRDAAINPETGTIIAVGQGLVKLKVVPN